MPSYEYRTEWVDWTSLEDALNVATSSGWELVSVVNSGTGATVIYRRVVEYKPGGVR